MTAVTGKENTTSERVRPRQRPVRSDFLVFPEICGDDGRTGRRQHQRCQDRASGGFSAKQGLLNGFLHRSIRFLHIKQTKYMQIIVRRKSSDSVFLETTSPMKLLLEVSVKNDYIRIKSV